MLDAVPLTLTTDPCAALLDDQVPDVLTKTTVVPDGAVTLTSKVAVAGGPPTSDRATTRLVAAGTVVVMPNVEAPETV